MGTRNIEKLLTDLKNLPKQNAPEDFEAKLLQRISSYENARSSGEKSFNNYFRLFYNPVYVPAFTIIIVALVIVYTIQRNKLDIHSQVSIEKAIPIVQEAQSEVKEPQKISVPKKKDYVVKRTKMKLDLGPGINLDETEYSLNPGATNNQFINFPFPDEPVTIRIPPPEVIFRQELERTRIPNPNKDSIKLTNGRR